jgi:glucose/mannose-6-phosphate isomerase
MARQSAKKVNNTTQMQVWLASMATQVEEALALGHIFSTRHSFTRIRKVLFYGMGGSAIGGDVLRAIMADRSGVLFNVFRQGRWSRWIDSETLVIFSSYSGNTGEILDVFNQAVKSKAQLLVLTSGGRLQEQAQELGVPCLRIPGGMPPRCALGFLTFSLLPVLAQLGHFKIPAAEIREVLSILRKVPRAKIKALARQLNDKLIHLYSASGFMQSAAIRWRAEIAENSKMIASHHLLPEMFHNEIEGWSHPVWAVRKSVAVFLTDKDDPKDLKGKIKAASRILESRGGKAVVLQSQGKTRLARLFWLISFGDWISYELALLNKVDPVAIDAIVSLKKGVGRSR